MPRRGRDALSRAFIRQDQPLSMGRKLNLGKIFLIPPITVGDAAGAMTGLEKKGRAIAGAASS